MNSHILNIYTSVKSYVTDSVKRVSIRNCNVTKIALGALILGGTAAALYYQYKKKPVPPIAVPPIARLNNDCLMHTISFLGLSDIATCCTVRKNWKIVIDGPVGQQMIWKQVSIREGIPIVQGENRNYKNDFKFLRPITISGRIISKYLGEIVGDIPLMREDRFTELRYDFDPFQPIKKRKATFVVLVDPSKIRITVCRERPLALDDSGETLVEIPERQRDAIVEEELTVPFSFKNLKMLATYPLAGMVHGCVFRPNSYKEVFDQCNRPSDQNRILIMRRQAVKMNRSFGDTEGQKEEVSRQGLDIVTVRERAFFDAIQILRFGTCPDTEWTRVNSGEIVKYYNEDRHANIGLFVRREGLAVFANYTNDVNPNLGVVPGVSGNL